jgi:hypothetical protein
MRRVAFPRRWFLGLSAILALLGRVRSKALAALVPTPTPATDLIRLCRAGRMRPSSAGPI